MDCTRLGIGELKLLIVSHRGQMREETLKSIAAQWMQEVKNDGERQQFEEQYAIFWHKGVSVRKYGSSYTIFIFHRGFPGRLT